jgi:elongation factor P
MLSANEFRRGVRIELDGDPYVLLDVHFQSPSARGASTLVKARVRNLRTGNVFDRTFRSGDKLPEPQVELRPIQYLYEDGAGHHFMDTGTYEQFFLSADDLGDAASYLVEGLEGLRSVVVNGRVLNVELPNTVVLKVRDTDPAIKGATAQAQTKPAIVETGLTIQVPSYLEPGESVVVDTRDGRFVSRAKG